jgi:hypothetical protein
MSDQVEILIPDLGESIVEVTLSKWLVEEGEAVEEDQPLVEVLSDKSDIEIPSPKKGVLVKKLIQENEKAQKGSVIGYLSLSAKPTVTSSDLQTSSPHPEFAKPSVEVSVVPQVKSEVVATPLAKKIALTKGIDLTGVQGRGVRGKVFSQDLFKTDSSEQKVISHLSQEGVSISSFKLSAQFQIKSLQKGSFLKSFLDVLEEHQKKVSFLNLGLLTESQGFVAPRLTCETFASALKAEKALIDLAQRSEDGELDESELFAGEGLIWFLEESSISSFEFPLEDPLDFTLSVSSFLPKSLGAEVQFFVKIVLVCRTSWANPESLISICSSLRKKLAVD